MRIILGCDHAGFELKELLAARLSSAGHDVVDVGALSLDPDDDYPSYCFAAAQRVVAEPGSLGIVIGGSGNGEQIAANKVLGARAALAWSAQTARLAREHNDANLIGLGARMHTADEAYEIVCAFLDAEFSGGRHANRVAEISRYEHTEHRPA